MGGSHDFICSLYMSLVVLFVFFFFSSRRRHTRYWRDWSSDVCSSDLQIRKLMSLRETMTSTRTLEFANRRPIASPQVPATRDRKSTRLNSSHANISYAVFCLKKKKQRVQATETEERRETSRQRSERTK